MFSTSVDVTSTHLDSLQDELPLTYIGRLEGIVEAFTTALKKSDWCDAKAKKAIQL